MICFKRRFLLALVLAMFGLPAFAGGYVTGGYMNINDYFGQAMPFDEPDNAQFVAFGWNFTPMFAGEIEYMVTDDSTAQSQSNHGAESSYALSFPKYTPKVEAVTNGRRYPPKPVLTEVVPPDVLTTYNLDSQAFTGWLTGKGTLATVMNRKIRLEGRVGVSVLQAELDVHNAYGSQSFSETAVGPAWGVGLTGEITPHLVVGAGYREYLYDMSILEEDSDLDIKAPYVNLTWVF